MMREASWVSQHRTVSSQCQDTIRLSPVPYGVSFLGRKPLPRRTLKAAIEMTSEDWTELVVDEELLFHRLI